MMTTTVLLEVCIDSVASGIAAEAGGAGRIELCSALSEGGLTPTVGFLKIIKKSVRIPVFCMIRPRCGDFLYSEDEIRVMQEDIIVLKANGADGFVFGILTKHGAVDLKRCAQLVNAAKPLPLTFHRAIDQVPDPLKAVEDIISLGFDRILTSGQASDAKTGIEVIKKMVTLSAGRIMIMAGAGINPGNVSAIIRDTGVTEVHASARKQRRSEMVNVSLTATMGKDADDMVTYVTDSDTVTEICKNANFID